MPRAPRAHTRVHTSPLGISTHADGFSMHVRMFTCSGKKEQKRTRSKLKKKKKKSLSHIYARTYLYMRVHANACKNHPNAADAQENSARTHTCVDA